MILAAVTRLAPLFAFAIAGCVKTAEPVAKNSPISAEADQTLPSQTRGRVTRIMLGDFFPLQQNNAALIFDVRPSFIYRLGHVPGAINWPKASFQSGLALHEPQILAARAAKKPVVLYCVDLACPDARTVADLLAARGHHVAVLEGGWDAWKTGDLPTE